MKILLVQLTRLGDVLTTLPVAKALKRSYPGSEVHILVRSKFAQGTVNLSELDRVIEWDSRELIKPVLTMDTGEGIAESIKVLKGRVEALRQENYDQVINLSYSPSSSFISYLIGQSGAVVRGYTRTSDLFLHIPDLGSQYFRAQVGVKKSNRLHVVDLMGWTAGVEVLEEDLRSGNRDQVEKYVVCHMGASDPGKSWMPYSWYALIRRVVDQLKIKVILIGSPGEAKDAEQMAKIVSSPLLDNRVGRTSVTELKDLIQKAALYVGCDSGPLHVANLANCPSLNLSVGNVRFWETGPTVAGSRVLVSEKPASLLSDRVFDHVEAMLTDQATQDEISFFRCNGTEGIRYGLIGEESPVPDSWDMVEWLYFGSDRKPLGDDSIYALRQLREAAELANTMLEAFRKNPDNTQPLSILEQVDAFINVVEATVPQLSPLVWDFKTKRENNPPGSNEEILAYSELVYGEFAEKIEQLLVGSNGLVKEDENELRA